MDLGFYIVSDAIKGMAKAYNLMFGKPISFLHELILPYFGNL